MGAKLDGLRSSDIHVFHDTKAPGRRGNIDHLVVTPGGVWVVDTKRYVGKRPELKVEGGFLRPRTETLTVGGSRSNGLVEGVLRQVDDVERVLGDVPIGGVLCFVDGDWPMFGGSITTQAVLVTWPRDLAQRIQTSTSPRIDPGEVARIVGSKFRAA